MKRRLGGRLRTSAPTPSSPAAMPPSPLWVEGLASTFYRLPPSGGKLLSEAKLMRGLTIERRADDIRPYTENVHDPRRGRRPRRPAGPSNTPRRGRSMCASRAAEDIRPPGGHRGGAPGNPTTTQRSGRGRERRSKRAQRGMPTPGHPERSGLCDDEVGRAGIKSLLTKLTLKEISSC